uniref:One cut domain family member n=1 Tax=Trichuris muris TaxID=70415 RepID=A0A5S6Q7F8_TRIMR
MMRELDEDDPLLRESRIETTIMSVVDQVRKNCFRSSVLESHSFSLNRHPVPCLPETLVDEHCLPLSQSRNGAPTALRDSRLLTSSASPVYYGEMDPPFAVSDMHQPPLVDSGLTQLSPMALPGLLQTPSSSRVDSLPTSALGSPFNSLSGFPTAKGESFEQANDLMLYYNGGELPATASVDMISLMQAGLISESNAVRPMDSNLHSLTCNELYSFTRPNFMQMSGENGHQGFGKILNSLEIPNSYSLSVPANSSNELNHPPPASEGNKLTTTTTTPVRTYITPTLLSVNGQEQQGSMAPESPLSHHQQQQQHTLSRPASVAAAASGDLPICGGNVSVVVVGHSTTPADFRCRGAGDKEGSSTGHPAPSRKRKHSQTATIAETDDNSYIDTKELCERISYELRSHTISQATFAARVLNRSQGTLSDLLRNPKPWNVLKSGRETFRRMYNWLQLPFSTRMQIFDRSPSEENRNGLPASSMAKEPMVIAKVRMDGTDEECTNNLNIDGSAELANVRCSLTKKRRFVFSESQKRALQAVFKVKPRPSRRVQEMVAGCLDLSRSTVQNFFMNARRRSRPSAQVVDQPLSHQIVRPISPPPQATSAKGMAKEGSRRNGGGNPSGNVSANSAAAGRSTTDRALLDGGADQLDPLVLLVMEIVHSEENCLGDDNSMSAVTSATASPMNDSA